MLLSCVSKLKSQWPLTEHFQELQTNQQRKEAVQVYWWQLSVWLSSCWFCKINIKSWLNKIKFFPTQKFRALCSDEISQWPDRFNGKLIQQKFISTYSVLLKIGSWLRSLTHEPDHFTGKLIQTLILAFRGMPRFTGHITGKFLQNKAYKSKNNIS